jgi:hypothetical protein
MPRELEPGRRYRVTFSEARCIGVGVGFTAAFVRWRPDPDRPFARWRDQAVWDNGVEIGPRSADWRADPAPSCEHTPETWC